MDDSGRRLRLGTRGSALARAQSTDVANLIEKLTGYPVDLVEIVTAGDRSTAPVAQLGVGVFVSALRDALLSGEIDVAVHSYKDLPTAPAAGLVIAAVPHRADPRDALVARDRLSLAELPSGSRVGTGSPRRVAQLLERGYGLVPVPLRGNVDTRLRRVAENDLDAVVLAAAGLTRLGRSAEATELLDPMLMLPAPAQGALAVECRFDDVALVRQLSALNHEPSHTAVRAERALLAALEAGCSAPVAALAEVTEDNEIYLRGAVIAGDGSAAVRLSGTGTRSDAEAIGRRLAAELLGAGADSLLGS
ncbi:MAG TPA: hydroxymethylbilane synthase [Micromonosporaceae bacterium]|nr:hydroxymethylbilane synthase [Micromonosporaceae bacterium]